MKDTLYMIMAGGRGERLRPLTDYCPKPLVRFGACGTIIDFTLYNCMMSGASDLVVLGEYLSSMLQRYIRQNWSSPFARTGKKISVMTGQGSQLGPFNGTADAVYRALQGIKKPPERVVVLAGDHIYRMDYSWMVDFHCSHDEPATVGAVKCNEWEASSFGIMQFSKSGKVLAFHEKPKSLSGIVPENKKPYASMGIYVFDTVALMDYLTDNRNQASHDFGRDILPQMAEAGEVRAYAFLDKDGESGYWRDVGDLSSYWLSNLELANGRGEGLFFDSMPELKHIGFSQAALCKKGGSMVSRNAQVGDAYIEESVIGPGVKIEDGACVQRSVVLDGSLVKSGVSLNSAIVEPMTEVRKDMDFSNADSLSRVVSGNTRVA